MYDANDFNETPNQNDDYSDSASDLFAKAAAACDAGDMVLGMHLYLAGYERAASDPLIPDAVAIAGLRAAWGLACDLKERSIAEYVFEKLEPYLSADEVSQFAEKLQDLALDRLEEFGFSRDELQDMADFLSQDFDLSELPFLKVEHIDTRQEDADEQSFVDVDQTDADDLPFVETSEAQAPTGQDGSTASSDDTVAGVVEHIDDIDMPEAPVLDEAEPQLNYATLAGYDETVAIMRDFGVGLGGDARFKNFVSLLNRQHGLERMPSLDTLLFRSPAREDATRFVDATIGELDLPTMRMSMDQNVQGVPVLCVTTNNNRRPRMNQAHSKFEEPAVLVLDDLDYWAIPDLPEEAEGLSGFMLASVSRGARETLDLIRAAVDDPDVFVLVTSATDAEVDPLFYDLLEPISIIDIDLPTENERAAIWKQIMQNHPSVRGIDLDKLVRFTAGMPRYDIYMAVREAIEEAYKIGLMSRQYYPVSPQNIFEKLAAYQPIDSVEYQKLEDAVLSDFRHDLDYLDDFIDNNNQ